MRDWSNNVTIGLVDFRQALRLVTLTRDRLGMTPSTAGSLFICAFLLSLLKTRLAWLVGLAVGIPVIAFNILVHGRFGSIAATCRQWAGSGSRGCCWTYARP